MRNRSRKTREAVAAIVVALCAPTGVLAQPRAVLPVTNFDFGQVIRGSLVYRDFIIQNKGSEPLIIQRIGLTRPLRTGPLPGVIKPGAQAGLRFALDTTSLSGVYNGSIQLYLNDPRLPVALLRFAGIIQSTVEVLPNPVLQLYARRGFAARKSVEIVSREPAPITILKIEHPPTRFTTSLETLEPGRRFRLTLTLKPDAPGGGGIDEILVRTSSRTTPLIRLTARTALLESLFAEPERLDFGALSLAAVRRNPALARKLRTVVTLHGLRGPRLELIAKSELDFLRLEPLPAKQDSPRQIAITPVPEKLRPGPFRGTVHVSINQPDFPAIRVKVSGTVTE